MKMKKKSLVLLIAAALLLTITVSSTVAYLVDSTDSLTNTFEPTSISSNVQEDPFDGKTKKNVSILVKGNLKVNVRAAIVVTWQDEKGNISSDAPLPTDYNMTINTKDWTIGNDGFYYLNVPIQATEAGVATPVLIQSCVVNTSKEGYHLVVEILGSCIQSNKSWSELN